MARRVFLTGATGFIGSQVARRLVADGCEVYALLRPDSNTWRIEDILPALRIVEGDLFALQELGQRLEAIKPDLCIHLAWYAEPGKYLTSLENVRYVSASLEMAARLARVGCERIVGAGTCIEYDVAQGYLTETSRLAPQTLYAASKLSVYLVLEQLARITPMSVAWVRFFYLYGPYEDERRLVSSVIRSLLQGRSPATTAGAQVRDWLHVADVASAAWAVAQSTLSERCKIGSGQPITVRQVVETIGDLLGKPELPELGALPYRADDPMFVCANNRRLLETGWTPRFDLKQGLLDAINWWKTR